MKVPRFKAKPINRPDVPYFYEGFYFQMPEVTYCPIGSCPDPVIKHYLASYDPGDWGLPNTPRCYEIDINTLEKIDEIEIK